ncbi:hypothetical protein DMENIID0001_058380 [Sergentomyia squamirostris]
MEETSILPLNKYCLWEIFSHLNILDLIQVEQVCERFRDMIQEIYARQWKKLDSYQLNVEMNITIYSKEMEVITEKVGAYVKELRISAEYVDDQVITGSFLPFLRDMEEVYLAECRSLEPINLAQMCENNPSIRSLDNAHCPKINQECINGLARCLQNLEILKIEQIEPLDLRILEDLPNLVHLYK